MKLFYTLFFTLISLYSPAQFYLNSGYAMSLPRQEMKENIKPLHSLAFSGLYKLPGSLNRIMLGADFSWGSYANTQKRQTFIFTNGATTETMVNYSSNVLQAGLSGRVLLLKNKALLPYINGKAGYASFYSNIFIEDPLDLDGCTPLDQKNLIKDGTITTGYGGGLMADWSLFSKKSRKNMGWIDLSVTSIRGSNINYINTKRLIDASKPPVNSDGKPLNVTFINASTQQLHEHQVAEVYNTPLRMMEIKLSATFLLF
jgi:hypothetical protein